MTGIAPTFGGVKDKSNAPCITTTGDNVGFDQGMLAAGVVAMICG
jgi:hypothetical protein